MFKVIFRTTSAIALSIVLTGTLAMPSKAGEAERLREVFVTVDGTRGVAAFVVPGDRIDIAVNRSTDGDEISAVVLKDVVVLAVEPVGKSTIYITTVEVNAEEAKKLALAREIGTFSFELKEAEDEPCLEGMVFNPDCLAQ